MWNYIPAQINKNLHIYQFKLKNILSYNDDFYCSVISIAFDNDYNIKYHTYYLRFKDKDINHDSPAVKW